MKNLISKLLSGIIISCAVFVFTGCAKKVKYEYPDAELYTQFNGNAISIDSQLVSAFDIDWLFGSVEIVLVSDIEQISIAENSKKSLKGNQFFNYYLQDGVLKIKYMSSSANVVKVNFEKNLTIQVPADGNLIDSICVKADSANVEICGTSTVFYKINSLNVSSDSGDVNLSDLYVKNAVLNNLSGNIKLRQGVFLNVQANNQSGGVYASGVRNNYFSGKTVSGSAVLSFETTPEDIIFESSSGDIELCLPLSNGFAVSYLTRSGKFISNIDGEFDNGIYVFGRGDKSYDITTTSGDLKLSKTVE